MQTVRGRARTRRDAATQAPSRREPFRTSGEVLPGGETRKSIAYRHIQSKIVSGALRAGEAISEVALSKEIGISRTPVREAIGQLLAQGFLKHIPGGGTVVNLPTRSDILELYELREALEVYAVGKAARQPLHPSDAQKLQEMCEDLAALAGELEKAGGNRRLDPEAMASFLALDMRFHMLLLRAAGNHRILKVVRDTRLMIRIFHTQRDGHDARQLRDIYTFHKKILEAVQKGDAAQAMSLSGEHIRISCKERLEAYERWERVSRISVDDAFLVGLDTE